MTENDINQTEVIETIEEIGPAEAFEIYDEMFDGKRLCSECGRETVEYQRFGSDVREIIRELLDKNRIVANSNWRYRVRDTK